MSDTENTSYSEAPKEPKMELITVNNFLVSLRKPIARGRVQIIHKMTRHIDQLQKKKGTEAQVNKNKRKAERLISEIKLLKTFKRQEIAKFAMLNCEKFDESEYFNPKDLNPDEILEKLRHRAQLRLVNHHLVRNEVNKFRQKHPEWKTEMEEILKVLGQKSRQKKELIKKAKRKQERLKRRLTKKSKKLDETHDEEGSGAEDQSDFQDGSESEAEKDLVDDDAEEDGSEVVDEESENSESEDEVISGNESDEMNETEKGFANTLKSLISKPAEDSEDDEFVESLKSSGKKQIEKKSNLKTEPRVLPAKKSTKKLETSNKNFFKSDGEVVIKRIDLNASNDDFEVPQKSATEENTQSEKIRPVIKDSFFLGGSSGADSGSESNLDEDEDVQAQRPRGFGRGLDASWPQSGEPMNRRQRRQMEREGSFTQGVRPSRGSGQFRGGRGEGRGGRGRGFSDRGRGFSDRGRGFSDRGRGFSDRSRGFGDRGFGDRGFGDRGFGDRGRGFNDRDRGGFGRGRFEDSSDLHPSWAAKKQNQERLRIGEFQGKKTKFGDDDSEKLHPSWEASKNQKSGITTFQGKKFKFDEDGDQQGSKLFTHGQKSANDLHPSWAAKKSSQSGIQQFQGQKIKFGDDDFSSSNPEQKSSTNLHPSWAAKKDQQKGIQAFQGKKVVFGDDDE